MLYLEAMGNLQLGNVHNYLYPIIQANYSQTTDFRFLAIFATMPSAHRSTEVSILGLKKKEIFFLNNYHLLLGRVGAVVIIV